MATPIEDLVSALVESHRELTMLVRLALLIGGGLVLVGCIVLIVFSPAVSGAKTSMIPGSDFAWFPLSNPGIVSIPLGFLLGIIGTLTSRDTEDPVLAAEMEVRSLTGVGAEKATHH